MDRTRFFAVAVADAGDGVMTPELDFLNNSLSGFVMNSTPAYYRVTESDMAAPDLIAFKVYQDERLWWVICLVNGIADISQDLIIGQLLVIPDKLDILNFYKAYRRR